MTDWKKEEVKKKGRTRGQWREQRNLNRVLRGELNLVSLFSLSSACSSSADLIFVSGSTCLSYSAGVFFLSLGLPINLPDLNLKCPWKGPNCRELTAVISLLDNVTLRVTFTRGGLSKRTFFGHTKQVWTFANQRGFPNAFCNCLQEYTDKW